MVSLVRGRCGRAASAYLALFFLAVAAAPHRHLNDLEDLFLDQRSDSGFIVQAAGPVGIPGDLSFQSARFVHDVPCPACFTRDFVCAPTSAFLFVADLGLLPLLSSLPEVARPALVPADAASRAPPRHS